MTRRPLLRASTLAVLTLAALAGCKNENDLVEQSGSDTWRQAANNKVDILFVVDNSSSMEQEQATLASGFVSFANRLEESGTDFRLGVITTTFEYDDPNRGQLVGDPLFLTGEDTDYVAQFAVRAQVGLDGDNKEKGLEAAAYALSPIANLDINQGFVRPDARLLVVFISDEEDCSDEGALGFRDPDDCYREQQLLVPVANYVDTFRSMKDAYEDVQVAAIVGIEADLCQEVYPSERYTEVARLTGGQVGNICDGDWSQMLANLGLYATGVIQSFQLSSAVKEDTLQVFVDDTEVTTGWTHDPETWFLHFDDASIPPRGSVINATYTVLPGQPRPPGQ